MANENCLEGMACPKCHSEGPFWIDVCTTVLMSDDGSDPWEGGDEEWDEESGCRCYECDFDGKVKDFQIENQEKTDE